MKKITQSQIIKMHNLLINETGGSNGLRDSKLLESAINSPFQTFYNQELYPDIETKAAKLGYYLVKNHPFVDGNKRIGVLLFLVYLEINNIKINATDNEIIELGLGLADGSIDDNDLLNWIKKHNSS